MKKILFYTGNNSRKDDLMLLILRIIAGSFMITHGAVIAVLGAGRYSLDKIISKD